MTPSPVKALPFILIGAGLIGILASLVLTYDTLQIMQNPSYVPPCNINPILSCGSVMRTEQASLLGIPNSILGLIAFSALATFGFMLAGGAQLKRWVWQLTLGVATIGVLIMHYLFLQAIFVLGTICPWCFVVWMITIPTFWYITLYTVQAGSVTLPATIRRFVLKYHRDILILWYVLILGILAVRFWDFWVSLI